MIFMRNRTLDRTSPKASRQRTWCLKFLRPDESVAKIRFEVGFNSRSCYLFNVGLKLDEEHETICTVFKI